MSTVSRNRLKDEEEKLEFSRFKSSYDIMYPANPRKSNNFLEQQPVLRYSDESFKRHTSLYDNSGKYHEGRSIPPEKEGHNIWTDAYNQCNPYLHESESTSGKYLPSRRGRVLCNADSRNDWNRRNYNGFNSPETFHYPNQHNGHSRKRKYESVDDYNGMNDNSNNRYRRAPWSDDAQKTSHSQENMYGDNFHVMKDNSSGYSEAPFTNDARKTKHSHEKRYDDRRHKRFESDNSDSDGIKDNSSRYSAAPCANDVRKTTQENKHDDRRHKRFEFDDSNVHRNSNPSAKTPVHEVAESIPVDRKSGRWMNHHRQNDSSPKNWSEPSSSSNDHNGDADFEQSRKRRKIKWGDSVTEPVLADIENTINDVNLSLDDVVRRRNLVKPSVERFSRRATFEQKSYVQRNFGNARDREIVRIPRRRSPLQQYSSEPQKLRPVVMDGSNIALSYGNHKNFDCKGIQVCVDYFTERGHEAIVIVPAYRMKPASCINWRILHELQEKRQLMTCFSRQVSQRKWVSSYDDRMIIQIAFERNGIIVSNDRFNDLFHEKPNWRETIRKRVLQYRFMPGKIDTIMFPEDPFGRYGPRLEDILRF